MARQSDVSPWPTKVFVFILFGTTTTSSNFRNRAACNLRYPLSPPNCFEVFLAVVALPLSRRLGILLSSIHSACPTLRTGQNSMSLKPFSDYGIKYGFFAFDLYRSKPFDFTPFSCLDKVMIFFTFGT